MIRHVSRRVVLALVGTALAALPGVAEAQSFSMGLLGNLPTFGLGPQAIATGDFNGDGKPDLAVADFGDEVYILLGNGLGGFAAAPASPFSVGGDPAAVAVGDFNGDGRLDLAVASAAEGNVYVLLGNGAGDFAAAAGSPFAVGLTPVSIAVGRFDAGATLDLAVVNNGDNNVSILLGNGAGGFAPAAPVPTDSVPVSVATADFNGDTLADLAVANQFSDTVSILLGDGAGGFTPAGSVLVGVFPVWVVTGDFDGNGRPDLAVLNDGSVSSLLGDGMGGFTPHPDSPFVVASCGCPTSLGITDLNGDGRLDLAVTNAPLDSVTILLGDGAGSFAAAPGDPVPTGFEPVAVAVADVNADGKPDLVAANSFSIDVSVILNLTCCYLTVSLAGAGGGSVTSSPAGIGCATACLRAFDPGTPVTLTPARLLGSRFAGWSGGVCTGRGPCVVPLMTDATVIATFEPLALPGDFDGDRRADLAVFRPPTGEWFFFNTATGFTGPVPYGEPGDRLVPADYDGDGRADLAVFRPSTGRVVRLRLGVGLHRPVPVRRSGRPAGAGRLRR